MLLISGAITVLKGKRIKLNLSRGNVLALLCGLFLGVGTFTARIAVRTGGLENYTQYGFLLQVSMLVFLAGPKLKQQLPEIIKSWKDIVIMGIGRFGQLFGFLLATVYASNLALVSSVTTFSVVLLFLSGYFFLKERDTIRQKLLGVALATCGLIISI